MFLKNSAFLNKDVLLSVIHYAGYRLGHKYTYCYICRHGNVFMGISQIYYAWRFVEYSTLHEKK